MSTCIFGATKVSQVEDNLKALEVAANWTKELEEEVEEALDNEPEPEMCFRTWKKKEGRRKVAIDYDMSV